MTVIGTAVPGIKPGDRPAYSLSAAVVVVELGTDPGIGLTEAEAADRNVRFGLNVLPRGRGGGGFARVVRQFRDPLVYVLLGSAAITLVLGQLVDSGVILAVVLLNAVIGYFQESRAEHALAALAALVTTEVGVVRDGAEKRIRADRLTSGDIVLLRAGDKVAADSLLISADGLETDESALTGEAAPIPKEPVALGPETALADRRNTAHAGTSVTRGEGRAVVVAIGAGTELGRINQLMDATGVAATPLTRKLAGFSRKLSVVIVMLAAVMFAIGLVRGYAVGEMFTAAVAMAVGAIPEGLPAAVTIVLAVGVVRMARRKAIVRRLPSVETLGGTTVICTDKTGTLTANRMTVEVVAAAGHRHDPSGSSPPDAAVRECLLAGVLCNDAEAPDGDEWQVVGDPTETALLTAAQLAGLDVHGELTAYRRLAELPFESGRQLMATVSRDAAGHSIGYVKGAPEKILALCRDQVTAEGGTEPLTAPVHVGVVDELAGKGLRVLAFARFTPDPQKIFPGGEAPATLTLLGLQAMHDPPRAEAIASVAACRAAGIEVKMITGDHGGTARAIAREFALTDGEPTVVTGSDIATTPDDVLAGTTVFARVSPEQKLRLVALLQERGHIVAMTGDGVNDGPALRKADIGVAMGRSGTEVAKEAADMVLAEDDFATIEGAVEEGRAVFDNIRKFLAWTLPTNLAEGLVVLVAIVVGAQLPMLPVQVLWINMTTAVFLGLPLAFEAKEAGLMTRLPRPPGQPMMTGDLVRRIAVIAVVLVAGSFAMFAGELRSGTSVTEARSLTITVFVFAQIAYLISCRSLERFLPSRRNPWLLGGVAIMIALQLAILYVPLMNDWFHTAPLALSAWPLVLGLAGAAYVVAEIDKFIARRTGRAAGSARGGRRR
ncbi:cation-translocating P-type ATPase [Amycolatopsis sp. H20-H5]|uniref:cation-translocating P-type ATPase n=1 Tax=Amycolatopsis sp. H20-H5 TaxID=3046309 RepID=UPI002DBDA6FE|nr:HAD-IC family P-type ATPase [Amycolatopsis sp. H20-H5]MEC3981665.1 HAD-IC family P-type ATPase [Amycolatopsis sp. H20-H5]